MDITGAPSIAPGAAFFSATAASFDLGASFWNQAFVADLRVNALGLIASPGWKASIGY